MIEVNRPAEIGLSSSRLALAFGLIKELVAEGKIPGAAIAIARHGAMLPVRAFGRMGEEADAASVATDTRFLLASISKSITATGVMALVEEGRIALDQPVAELLPEFGTAGKGAILIKHLLTHTSGLASPQRSEIFEHALRRERAPIERYAQEACKLGLLFRPGTDVQYCSQGFTILGEVVKRVTGQTLPQYLRRRIFEPAGMADTSLGGRREERHRVSRMALSPEQREMDPDNQWMFNSVYWLELAAPWAGVVSTASDIARFMQLFLDGGLANGTQVLSPATVRAMITNQTALLPGLPEEVKLAQKWGFGWMLASAPWFSGITSQGTFGHWGASGTMAWADPEFELVCVLLTNQQVDLERWHVRKRLSAAAAGALLAQGASPGLPCGH